MKVSILNIDKKEVGNVELPEEVFAVKPNKALIYEVIKQQRANKRKGCAATRNHKMVSGTTAKMYRQKGTGRARHGDYRTNIFVGGGKAFGPHPKDYSYRLPKQARKGGVRSALSVKVLDGKLIILDEFKLSKIKTKDAVAKFEKLGVKSGLIVVNEKNENLEKSVRNIKYIKCLKADSLNAYDIMGHDYLLILKDALTKVEEVLKP